MRKITAVVLAVVLCAAFAAGCSESAKSVDDFESWTKSDWDGASDEDKDAVAEKVLVAVGETLVQGFGDQVEQLKSEPESKEQYDAEIAEMKSMISEYFDEEPDGTLSGIVTQVNDLLGAVLNEDQAGAVVDDTQVDAEMTDDSAAA